MITTEINGRTFEIDGQGELSPTLEITLEDWLHGMSIKDAAQKRHRSEETIKTHRKELREQTHQKNGPGVLVYFISKNYVRALVITLSVTGGSELVRTRPVVRTHQSPKVAQVMRVGRHEISGVVA